MKRPIQRIEWEVERKFEGDQTLTEIVCVLLKKRSKGGAA